MLTKTSSNIRRWGTTNAVTTAYVWVAVDLGLGLYFEGHEPEICKCWKPACVLCCSSNTTAGALDSTNSLIISESCDYMTQMPHVSCVLHHRPTQNPCASCLTLWLHLLCTCCCATPVAVPVAIHIVLCRWCGG